MTVEVPHPLEPRGNDNCAPAEDDRLPEHPVEKRHVPLAADARYGSPLLVAGNPAGWNRRVHHKERAGPIGNCGLQRLEVESPATPVPAERHELRRRTDKAHPLEHSRVGGVGEDDLVAWICQDEKGVEHGGAVAVGDDDLAVGVVLRATPSRDQLSDRLFHLVEPGEGQI